MTMTTDNSNKILNAPDCGNAPKLRFPEFSEEYTTKTIGQLTTKVGSGVTPKGGENVYTTKGHPFVRSQNVGNGQMFLEDIAFIDENTHKKQIATEIQKGDVLLNITGASIGRSSVAFDEVVGGNVNQHVCIVRPNREILPHYLCYLFLSDKGQKQIDSFQAGGNRQGLNFEQIKSFKFSIPTLAEQEKVSDLLFLIDDRIKTQSRAIEKLQSLISGLQETILWQNHKRVSFSEIFIERNERTTVINQYEVLSSTAKGIYKQSDYFDKEVASTNNVGYKVLHKGDIVLSPQNLWLGNINYNDAFEIGMVSPSYKVFSIREQFNPVYVASILKTHRALFEYASASEQGASVVRRNLNMDAFMAICIPIPSKQTQDQVAKLFLSLNKKFKNEVQMLERFNKQKAFLLSHMFI